MNYRPFPRLARGVPLPQTDGMLGLPALEIKPARALAMTQDLRAAIGLLRCTNAELSGELERLAGDNPFVQIVPSPVQQIASIWQDTRTVPAVARPPVLPPPPRGLGQISVEQAAAGAPGLHDHVCRQIGMMFRDEDQRRLALCFAEALEPTGWLGLPIASIAGGCGVPLQDAEAVLARLQQVEPAGLFARSLAECLSLQAVDQGLMTPAFAIVLQNLPMLAKGDLAGLATLCALSEADVHDILLAIRRLNPKPGASFDPAPPQAVEPDMILRRCPSGWVIELNRSTLPGLVVQDPAGPEASAESRRAAEWLHSAVDRRNATTLKVGQEVVRLQLAYLEGGPVDLVPMSFGSVAASVGVHETTISRVTAGLLVSAPGRGFLLRDLFSNALPRTGGGGISAASVRHQIAALIAAERPEAPLSDAAIAAHFQAQGVTLARRTVVKYREMLKLPAAARRRALVRQAPGT